MSIVLENICFSYENKLILQDFSLTIEEGEITIVMSASGAGKTTFLRILAGLETAKSGMITGLKGNRISMVFQEDRLLEQLTVLENLRFVCGLSMCPADMEKELSQVGLQNILSTPVRELSGGMKRRVALVRALIVPFDLLILDEPFQGLDDDNKKGCISYLLSKGKGKTIVLVTHEKEEAAALKGRVITLADRGKIS